MGSFNGTCHLSGIGISANESVIMVPVRYSHLTNSTTQVYSSDRSAHIAGIPLKSYYDEYGSVDKIENDWLINPLLNDINKGLINNEKFNPLKGYFFGNRYALLKRDGFPNQFQNLEFLSDHAIIKKMQDRENLHNIQKIEDKESFISLLSSNELFSVSGDTVYRHGHILIKSSFLNKLIQSHYKINLEKIKIAIQEHIMLPLEDDVIKKDIIMMHGNKISKDYFSSRVLNLLNDNHTISYEEYEVLKQIRAHYLLKKYDNKELFEKKISEFVNSVALQTIISVIYADIGKTFYPNASTHTGHKALYNYAKVLKSELEDLNSKNKEEYSLENGYDLETQKRYQWNTPNIY